MQRAAERTTEAQPFLMIADPKDRAFLFRAVINVLSERFADVFLAENLGLPVRAEKYVFGLTFERYAVMRTYKLRVLLASERELVEYFSEEGASRVRLTSSVYVSRLQTLRVMHDLYVEQGDKDPGQLGWVVLGVAGGIAQ